MLQRILGARSVWEREQGRRATAVHASPGVIDALRRTAMGIPDTTMPLQEVWRVRGIAEGCDWYVDHALAGDAFRFE